MVIGGTENFFEFYIVIKGSLSNINKKGVILGLFSSPKAHFGLILFLLLRFQQKTLYNIGN